MQQGKRRDKQEQRFPCLVAEQEHSSQCTEWAEKCKDQQCGFTDPPSLLTSLHLVERKQYESDAIQGEVDYTGKNRVCDL